MRRRRLAAAALGLALAAGGVAPGVHAQTTPPSDCTAVDRRDEMSIQVGSPTPGETRTTASVPIEVQVTNTSTRKTLPTDPDPKITEVRLALLACRDGQVLPEEATRSSTGDPADTISLSWTTEPIPTNGPFAIEIVATGNRQGNPPQSSRVVVPFALEVTPKRPSGVKAAANETGATISWSNTPREVDLLFYEVQRAAQGSGTYVTIDGGIVKANVASVTDTPGTGAWRYRVFAIRAGAAEDEGISSLPSSDATVEVAAPATPDDGSDSSTSSGTSSGSGTSSSSGSGTTSGTTRPSDASGTGTTTSTRSPSGTVNLSEFSAALNARRQATTPTTRRPQPPDTGFQQTLPFAPRTAAPTVPPPVEEPAPPQELGVAEQEEAVGERLISNDEERRRSLGFIAGGFLLFVLSMTGLFLKSEVRRADELEALGLLPATDADAGADPAAVDTAAAAALAGAPLAAAAPVAVAAVATRRSRRGRGTAPTVAEESPAADAAAVAPAAVAAPGRARRRRAATADAVPAAPVATTGTRRRRRTPAADGTATGSIGRTTATGSSPAAGFTDDSAGGATDDFADLAEPAATAPLPPRRVRRTFAPLDAPTLDVAEPAVAPASGNPTRTRTTSAHARRTPARLPSRPADDRREGGAAVRPRRRRTGEGDRRLPVG